MVILLFLPKDSLLACRDIGREIYITDLKETILQEIKDGNSWTSTLILLQSLSFAIGYLFIY